MLATRKHLSIILCVSQATLPLKTTMYLPQRQDPAGRNGTSGAFLTAMRMYLNIYFNIHPPQDPLISRAPTNTNPPPKRLGNLDAPPQNPRPHRLNRALRPTCRQHQPRNHCQHQHRLPGPRRRHPHNRRTRRPHHPLRHLRCPLRPRPRYRRFLRPPRHVRPHPLLPPRRLRR